MKLPTEEAPQTERSMILESIIYTLIQKVQRETILSTVKKECE